LGNIAPPWNLREIEEKKGRRVGAKRICRKRGKSREKRKPKKKRRWKNSAQLGTIARVSGKGTACVNSGASRPGFIKKTEKKGGTKGEGRKQELVDRPCLSWQGKSWARERKGRGRCPPTHALQLTPEKGKEKNEKLREIKGFKRLQLYKPRKNRGGKRKKWVEGTPSTLSTTVKSGKNRGGPRKAHQFYRRLGILRGEERKRMEGWFVQSFVKRE